MSRPMQGRWASLALLSSLFAGPTQAATPPKLVVLIVVDQLGSNYITRYGEHLGGGLQKMAKRGAFYPNGVHAIANSATGPGHANVSTGAWPDVHGIVSNKWPEAGTGREVYCMEDARLGVSPANLEAPTIADAMKLAFGGRSRVVALGGKDRGAILLGGQKPDHAIWYDERSGQYVSSGYQSSKTPAWLATVNLELAAAPVFGKVWEPFRKDLDYARIAGPDDSPREEEVAGIGRRFPRTLGQGLPGPGAAWFDAYSYAPQASESLFALAKLAFDEEKLGRGPAPDLLALSVSSLDFVGHSYGLESQEAFDTLLRIDADLGALMKHFESKLGGDSILWVLSADHGVAPTPERAERDSGFGHRVNKLALETTVNGALASHADARLRSFQVILLYGPEVFLSPGGSEGERLAAARAAASALRQHPSIAEAHAHVDLAGFTSVFRPYFERLVFPGRTADLFIRVKPGHVVTRQDHGKGAGSNHGTPYAPDTHVPIYLVGPGVRRGIDRRSVHVTRIAPSVAALLQIDPPAAALEAPLPASLPN